MKKETKKSSCPVWKIPVTWEVCGFVSVQAETLGEAMKIAKDGDNFSLPQGEYVDGSWSLSSEDEELVLMCYNREMLNKEKE